MQTNVCFIAQARPNLSPVVKCFTCVERKPSLSNGRYLSPLLSCTQPSFSSSVPLIVLQERHVWAEDAGGSQGCVGVRSVWGEACSLALQLHSIQDLHREVAHMKPTR